MSRPRVDQRRLAASGASAAVLAKVVVVDDGRSKWRRPASLLSTNDVDFVLADDMMLDYLLLCMVSYHFITISLNNIY